MPIHLDLSTKESFRRRTLKIGDTVFFLDPDYNMMNDHELLDDLFGANYRKFVAVVSSARMFSLGGVEEMARHMWVRDYDAEFLVFGIPVPSIKGFREWMIGLHLLPMEYKKKVKLIPLKPFPCNFDCGDKEVTIKPLEYVNQHSIDWTPCIRYHEDICPGYQYVINAMNCNMGMNDLNDRFTRYLKEQDYDESKDLCTIYGRYNNKMIIYTRSELV